MSKKTKDKKVRTMFYRYLISFTFALLVLFLVKEYFL